MAAAGGSWSKGSFKPAKGSTSISSQSNVLGPQRGTYLRNGMLNTFDSTYDKKPVYQGALFSVYRHNVSDRYAVVSERSEGGVSRPYVVGSFVSQTDAIQSAQKLQQGRSRRGNRLQPIKNGPANGPRGYIDFDITRPMLSGRQFSQRQNQRRNQQRSLSNNPVSPVQLSPRRRERIVKQLASLRQKKQISNFDYDRAIRDLQPNSRKFRSVIARIASLTSS